MQTAQSHIMLTILHSPRWLSLHGLIVVIGLLIYVLTTHALQQRRAPASAISWVLMIALIPYVGVPLYLLFGTRKLVRSGNHILGITPAPGLDSDDAWPRQLAASMGQPPVASYRRLRLHAEGREALQALWELIDGAEHELVLCTFILGRDAIGRALMARLIAKARGGVTVRLLIDGTGHVMGGMVNLRKLKAAGVQVALYGPIFHVPFRVRANLRNHRKMLVADGTRLWCGGRNFAAEYFDGVARHGPWKDLSFDLEGPLAAQARELFERDWAFARGSPKAERAQAAQIAHEPFAQVIASGPDQSDDTVHDLLVTACFKARSRIAAVTPYFVPSDALLMALSLAARRGVMVDLILPRRSNHAMADFVRHRAIRELAAAGGRVWLAPYMMHAKAVVVDEGLALSGSANLDSRSMFVNYEMMVMFYDVADTRRFAGFIEMHREASRRYLPRKPGLLRDLAEGLLLWLAFQL
jgi:cardiolipin synthase